MIQSASFPAASSSAKQARAFAAVALGGVDPEILRSVALMVSELASNAVRHAESAFTVSVERTDAFIRISVTDDGPGWPTPRRPGPQEFSGRGLLLVEQLADDWGIDHRSTGKSVWARLSMDSQDDPPHRREQTHLPESSESGGPRGTHPRPPRPSGTACSDLRTAA